MKICAICYQGYNYKINSNDNKQTIPYIFSTNFQRDIVIFTGTNNLWEKAKDLGKKVVDNTKETFSDFSKLFNDKSIDLSEEEETFLDSYMKKEEDIKAEYDKKIAAVKDGFFDGWTNSSEKQRQKLRDEKQKALKIAYAYQELFEQREREAIDNRNKFYELAKQLNMSKEILAAFESSQLSSQKRLEIINRRKELLDKKGFSQIGGYIDEKNKLQESFLDKIDDEKAGKYLTTSIPNAILFYGPTGCGKTTFVKALAQEADCNFVPIQCRGTQKDKEQKLYEILPDIQKLMTLEMIL